MLYRISLAFAAFCAVPLFLRGWSHGPGHLVFASTRIPATPVRLFAPPVIFGTAGSGAEKSGGDDKAKKKPFFKMPAFMRQCEYSWDCDSPMECCEVAGASFCCRGGVGVPSFRPVPQLIPIPIDPPGPSGGYPQGY
jgi:hypothetical protein